MLQKNSTNSFSPFVCKKFIKLSAEFYFAILEATYVKVCQQKRQLNKLYIEISDVRQGGVNGLLKIAEFLKILNLLIVSEPGLQQ